jgi:hypothetical protein
MDPTTPDHRQIIANFRMMQKLVADTLGRAAGAVERARATLERLRQGRAVEPAVVSVMSSNQTRLPPPPCPRCRRIDRTEEEEQTGSSQRWFLCERCGLRYPSVPPRRG